jgi:transposase
VVKIIRIGMDTSKNVFQLHGVDEQEQPVLRKTVRRRDLVSFFAKLEPTKVGIEACGASHYWARTLKQLGHEAVLLPPIYVKAYVKRGKNDKIDAEAICEAMSRPSMRTVSVKSIEQQAGQVLIGTREALLRRRTQVSNSIRGYASEFGLVASKGLGHIEPLLVRVQEDKTMPSLAKEVFAMLAGQFQHANAQIKEIDAKLMAVHRTNELSRRLAQVPGLGPIGATAMAIKVTDPKVFRCGRDFAAWIGLTPKDHTTAGRKRRGVITKAGDEMLRSLLICGATAVIQQAKKDRGKPSLWLSGLVKRKEPKLAAVALANKNARIAWKLIVSGERYNPKRSDSQDAAREGRCAALLGGSATRPSLSSTTREHKLAMTA